MDVLLVLEILGTWMNQLALPSQKMVLLNVLLHGDVTLPSVELHLFKQLHKQSLLDIID